MKGSLLRYRILAWTVGVMLLLVVAATIVKYAAEDPQWIERVGPVHGFLYVVYLITAIDLAMRVRWSWSKTLLVCLAGTIPFLSFVAERRVNREVSATITADSGAA